MANSLMRRWKRLLDIAFGRKTRAAVPTGMTLHFAHGPGDRRRCGASHHEPGTDRARDVTCPGCRARIGF